MVQVVDDGAVDAPENFPVAGSRVIALGRDGETLNTQGLPIDCRVPQLDSGTESADSIRSSMAGHVSVSALYVEVTVFFSVL